MAWRVVFGLTITIIWATTGLTCLSAVVGMNNFIHLPTAAIGSVLQGAFAPLACLWLVIGHFMQQREIAANIRPEPRTKPPIFLPLTFATYARKPYPQIQS